MDEIDIAYIAGVVDSIALFRVKIKQDDRMSLGYTAVPMIRIHRSGNEEIALGMIDDYCAEQRVPTSMGTTGGSGELAVRGTENIKRFFDLLAPLLIQKHERLSIFCEEILPRLDKDGKRTKQEFIELMEWVDKLYEQDPKMHTRKYDADFFKQKWSDSQL